MASQRAMIGVIASVLLCTAGLLWLLGSGGDAARAWISACLRIGVVMGLYWLAEPELRRMPTWVMLAVVLVVALAFIFRLRPQYFLIVAAVLFLAAVIRPRKPAPGSRRGR